MDIEVAFAANATKYRARCKGIFNVDARATNAEDAKTLRQFRAPGSRFDGDAIIEAIRYPVSSLRKIVTV